MSENVNEEFCPLVDRCLVIVFKEKRQHVKSVVDQNDGYLNSDKDCETNGYSNTVSHGNYHSGKELYDEFVAQNKGCFWDPHLEESLNNVHVIGYIYPHVLLIGGRDIYLNTVKGAWSRRVLNAPQDFSIYRVGKCCTPCILKWLVLICYASDKSKTQMQIIGWEGMGRVVNLHTPLFCGVEFTTLQGVVLQYVDSVLVYVITWHFVVP